MVEKGMLVDEMIFLMDAETGLPTLMKRWHTEHSEGNTGMFLIFVISNFLFVCVKNSQNTNSLLLNFLCLATIFSAMYEAA